MLVIVEVRWNHQHPRHPLQQEGYGCMTRPNRCIRALHLNRMKVTDLLIEFDRIYSLSANHFHVLHVLLWPTRIQMWHWKTGERFLVDISLSNHTFHMTKKSCFGSNTCRQCMSILHRPLRHTVQPVSTGTFWLSKFKVCVRHTTSSASS